MHLLCTFLNELMIDLFSEGYHNNNYCNILLSLFFIYCIGSEFILLRLFQKYGLHSAFIKGT